MYVLHPCSLGFSLHSFGDILSFAKGGVGVMEFYWLPLFQNISTKLLCKKVDDLYISYYLIATVYFIVGVYQVEF